MGFEDFTGDTGTAFVDAIIFTIAEVALHVAFGGNRKVNSPKFPFNFRVETGMLVEV
jgi:hypothetical protein